MVTKKEYDLVIAEVHDLRNIVHELRLHREVQEDVKESVDKVNGEESDRMLFDDTMPNVPVPDDRFVMDNDEPIDILRKSNQKIIDLELKLNKEEFKIKSDAICPVCSSPMSAHKIMDEMMADIDSKTVQGGEN